MNNVFVDPNGKLVIEDARLIYRNFTGAASQYNHEGDKNFCVFIDDPKVATQLEEEGWNVKVRKPREEGDPVTHFIKVNVSYRFREPRITMHTSSGAVTLHEDTVNLLDTADILSADIVINPSHWDRGNDKGISAYLDSMHVVIQEDYFASKYAATPLDFGEAPEE